VSTGRNRSTADSWGDVEVTQQDEVDATVVRALITTGTACRDVPLEAGRSERVMSDLILIALLKVVARILSIC